MPPGAVPDGRPPCRVSVEEDDGGRERTSKSAKAVWSSVPSSRPVRAQRAAPDDLPRERRALVDAAVGGPTPPADEKSVSSYWTETPAGSWIAAS